MNKKFLIPFALSSVAFALVGCGGESGNVKEDPFKGVTTTSSGCTPSNTSNACLGFYVDYPVENLNFDCSSSSTEHYATVADGNTVTGGCLKADKVNFFIQGAATSRKINLGQIDLAKIRPLPVAGQIVPIRLVDIATAMTGKTIVNLDTSDETYRVLVGIIRTLQATGVEQQVHLAGDLQQITLRDDLKNNLKNIESDVTVTDFSDGNYVTKLKPWLDLTTVSQDQAVEVANQLIKLSNVNVYTANFFSLSADNVDYGGFHGSTSSGKESIANLYLLTDRTGHTQGYTVQWSGIPISTSTGVPIIGSAFGRMNLLVQVAPLKLDATAQDNWLNPITKKINSALSLKAPTTLSESMSIYQGTLFNDTTIPGSEYVYNKITGDTKAPDPSVYGKWEQTLNGDKFTGAIDIFKSSPATQLNNLIFTTQKNVSTGKPYVFPLYANLTFNFNDKSNNPDPVTLGIVIDENGDIRTNMTSATDLKATQCNSVDGSLKDTVTGVQQYRIGTTGAANNEEADKTVTLRMILANPIFGKIDGAIIGLNENLITPQVDTTGDFKTVSSSGVRINLQYLLADQSVSKGINITGWSSSSSTATWVNMHSAAQSIFNTKNADKATAEQKALVTRQDGSLSIKLADCYTIKTK